MPQATLDDKYVLEKGRAYLSGLQALARLPMLQHERDSLAGLNTAGFISGYRGSPLGGFDQELWRAKSHLQKHKIVFSPGVNEDLAATAVWGSQQTNLFDGATVDGVFSIWYGKGPGVDRSGDVFRHANAAGTSKHGGVIAVAGDDHAAKSSTLPHQTEHVFKAVMMPILFPANVQEYLDLGIHAFAMSRYSGCWVAFKAINDTVESSASAEIDAGRVVVKIPQDYKMPQGGLNIRWPDPPPQQELRLLDQKLYAALAYCRANHLNEVAIDSPNPRLGIMAAGKSYLDVRQALDDLGIDENLAAQIGIRVYKIAMTWPLESEGVRRFAKGLEEILVVEEKRQFLEYQLKEELYNWREDARPRVVGKFDEKGEWSLPHGDWLLPAKMELSPSIIAKAIASRIAKFYQSDVIAERLRFLRDKENALAHSPLSVSRMPFYCPGCPHNTSTRVPENSRALAGIGCHYMAQWIFPGTDTFSQMGGEGAAWIGQSPFTKTKHVFVNLGDGTYFHSGILAIRAAIAANVCATYKILYNDAVAMTGGQPIDGNLSPSQITKQVEAEGVKRIAVVSDSPKVHQKHKRDFAAFATFHHRKELPRLQKKLREWQGVSVILYEQTCAAEKRRRRKRGQIPDPPRRVFINASVCEGCGDCQTQSNCIAVAPLETEFGRKRQIDQSACNKDFSCADGFCPSFVVVENAVLRKSARAVRPPSNLPTPELPNLSRPFGVVVAGVGGTGIVTAGALIGMAAHLEGRGVSVLGQTGLAQKGGAVMSHVRLAKRAEELFAVRIADGEADALLGADAITAASADSLVKMQKGRTRVALNVAETPTADFVGNPDWDFPLEKIADEITAAVGKDALFRLDAFALSSGLFGDSVGANTLMLGYAWQLGMIPVGRESLLRAIELNGVAVEKNCASFEWGRFAAVNPDEAAQAAGIPPESNSNLPNAKATAESLTATRAEYLRAYQDDAYAERYRRFVHRARVRGQEVGGEAGGESLAAAAAKGYFKLLAIKDEYEVARLFSDGAFEAELRRHFEDGFRLRFLLSPPLIAPLDRITGRPRKFSFGGGTMKAFRLLAKLKRLRGTPLDIFGYAAERKLERAKIGEYEKAMESVLAGLSEKNLSAAAALAESPEQVRGFGFIKIRAAELHSEKLRESLAAFSESSEKC